MLEQGTIRVNKKVPRADEQVCEGIRGRVRRRSAGGVWTSPRMVDTLLVEMRAIHAEVKGRYDSPRRHADKEMMTVG